MLGLVLRVGFRVRVHVSVRARVSISGMARVMARVIFRSHLIFSVSYDLRADVSASRKGR